MSVPLHERSLPIEDLLVMILLVANKGKEYHYAGAARLDGLPGCSPPWKM